MPLQTVKVDNPNSLSLVLGQSPVKNPTELIHTVLVDSLPDIKFGLAFNEGLVEDTLTFSGTDDELIALARENAYKVGAGRTFILFSRNTGERNIMQLLKEVSVIRQIYCATTGPVEVLIMEGRNGRGVMGLVDDYSHSDGRSVRVVKNGTRFFGSRSHRN